MNYPLQSLETFFFQVESWKNSCCTSIGEFSLILVALDWDFFSLDSNLCFALGIQNPFSNYLHPMGSASQSLCRHSSSTTSGFSLSRRSQIDSQRLGFNHDMYFSVRKQRCGMRACEANRMQESRGQCLRVGRSAPTPADLTVAGGGVM